MTRHLVWILVLGVLAGCRPGAPEAKASPAASHAEAGHADGDHAEKGHADGPKGHAGEPKGHDGDEHEGHGHEAPAKESHPHGAEDEHGHDAHEHAAHDHEPGVVSFDEAQQRANGIHVVPVAERVVDRPLDTTGEIAENTDAEAHVTPRVAGRVLQVRKTVGDQVRAGETLVTLESETLGEAQAGFLEALSRRDLAVSTLARQRTLHKGELTARKEVLAAEHEARLADIALEAARNRLRLMGVAEGRMATLAARRRLDPRVAMAAPIGGVIVAKHVTLGEMIAPGEAQPAYVISDPTTLWVHANLYERDLARVKPGQAATVTTPAYPGKVYQGRVSVISTMLDKDTRTARARVAVTNADRALKPGMFASIRLLVGRERALVVPVSAVLLEKEKPFVFVLAGPGRFARREVALDPAVNGVHVVRTGLRAGEQVVAAGAFLLKSELMKESFGGHSH